MGIREEASTRIDATPDAVFGLITDAARLAEWNDAITGVVEAPGHLEVGSIWKVTLHALGQTWVSRSQVTTYAPESGRFSYRSQSDDGNPSYADWEWTVSPAGNGSDVTVAVVINPETFWRKHLLVKVRRPGLRKEMQRSLATLSSHLQG